MITFFQIISLMNVYIYLFVFFKFTTSFYVAVTVELLAIPPNPSTVGENVALSCVMAAYIHPNTSFLWRRMGEVIVPSEKFEISYIILFADQAQNGGNSLTFSISSSIVIINLDQSDAGLYTCFVAGTTASAGFELVVQASAGTSAGISEGTFEVISAVTGGMVLNIAFKTINSG